MIEDITEHRLSVDALRETERHFRSIFEHATEGIFQTTAEGEFLNAVGEPAFPVAQRVDFQDRVGEHAQPVEDIDTQGDDLEP